MDCHYWKKIEKRKYKCIYFNNHFGIKIEGHKYICDIECKFGIEKQSISDCPFCGCNEFVDINIQYLAIYEVVCADCCSTSGYFSDPSDAIESWNKRINQ